MPHAAATVAAFDANFIERIVADSVLVGGARCIRRIRVVLTIRGWFAVFQHGFSSTADCA